MTTEIERLERCLTFWRRSPDGLVVDADWRPVEQVLGRLPSDYKRFVERRGQGSIDFFLHVCGAASLAWTAEAELAAMRDVRSSDPECCPMPLFPEPAGWLPWGTTDNGNVCWWNRRSDDPDEWTVAVTGRGPQVWEHPGGMADFLDAVLRRACRCPLFPADFPGDLPVTYGGIGDAVD
ncbi:MAG: SMI1/KNR4 family protein [Sandaracinus sp.]|nr:SMI1/KNR4 family protein [Sandaracinus sp.]MCB9622586.1 SMI1/KNR4 family protein [Sandaracinus sp.]MCB9635622.1 SMI1/KNR4 family protein [Sandaracinus sp.]